MRSLVSCAIVLLLVSVGGTGYVTRAGASVEAPPGKVSNLRVCSATAYSRSQARCTKDERKTVLISNRISCTVDVVSTRTALLRARMTYEGRVVTYGPWKVRPGTWRYWINQDLKMNLPLPGGRWGCSFTLGSSTVKATFRSGGPTGDIVNTVACRGENTVAYDSGFRVCRSDESAAPIQSTSAAYCNAAYPNDAGRLARLEILVDGRILQEVSFTVEEPLWVGTVFASAPQGQLLPAGKYACRFYLDNALVIEKPFDLLG